jgi:hypothetical protein
MLPYGKMRKADKEIGDILEFIRDSLARIKHGGEESLTNFARHNGLLQKNLTNFLSYGPTSNPSIKITYKILRGLLGRPPISLNDPLDLKIRRFTSAQERDAFGILDKVIALLHSGLDLAELSGIIDIYSRRLDASPRKAGEGP